MNFKGIILFTLMGLFLTGCVENFFYHPTTVIYDDPSKKGLHYEEVIFESLDGTKLSGWFIPAVNTQVPAKGTVIHMHGNAQNMTAHWQYVQWLPSNGYNLFVFDYRGYGKSEGRPEPKGVYEDSVSAIQYIRSRPDIDKDKIVVFGQSLGGANAIAAVGSIDKSGIKAVIVDSTFYSYSKIANDKFFGAGTFLNNDYSPNNYIMEISPVPILMVHGTADKVIPFEHSRMLMELAREPKELITIENGNHTDALSGRYGTKYHEKILGFINRNVSLQ